MNKVLVAVAMLVVSSLACLAPPEVDPAEYDAYMQRRGEEKTQELLDKINDVDAQGYKAIQEGNAAVIEAQAQLREADGEFSKSPAGGVEIYKEGFSDGTNNANAFSEVQDKADTSSTMLAIGGTFLLGVIAALIFALKK